MKKIANALGIFSSKLTNPWINLPFSPPYLLNSDTAAIIRFNEKASPDYRVHDELLPEPFLGNSKVKIVFLNLNPGYSEQDSLFHHGNTYFIEKSRSNLAQAESEYPFYLLNPEISTSPGHIWWAGKLKELISRYGLKRIANEICCIEYFPYHTKKFKPLKQILESQKYGFKLVKDAIDRNALIVIMRAKNAWLEAVPELKNYNYYTLNSSQNVTISKNNLPNGFCKIVDILN